MKLLDGVFRSEEQAIYSLRALYKQYGYSLYKISKFEEYDLYAHNKNFLVSQNILSFTDTNGKLLALKPDVTLSIVKNVSDHETVTHKLCYNEHVYRTSADSDGFREIMQTGLECIGQVDLYAECEVIMLALRSLETIGNDYILDLSHMGIIEGLLDEAGLDGADRGEIIDLMGKKNHHALSLLCERKQISKEFCERLNALIDLYLPVRQAMSILKTLVVGEKMQAAYTKLEQMLEILSAYDVENRLFLDFSIVNDVTYYDGVIFKGYINGIPDSVLSGGRYDRLLERLGRKSGAIGFAVYLDRLAFLPDNRTEYDVDVVLVYDSKSNMSEVLTEQKRLLEEGKRVLLTSAADPMVTYRQMIIWKNGGMETLETND